MMNVLTEADHRDTNAVPRRNIDYLAELRGGVKGLIDIDTLMQFAADGIEGVITGRALYDGRLDLAAALRVAGGI